MTIVKPKIAIFDWDNTLVDSWHKLHATINHVASELGVPQWSVEQVQHTMHKSSRDFFPSTFGEDWEKAKREVYEKFRSSTKLELVRNLVKDFQDTHPKIKYWSDFKTFIQESNIEDFYRQEGDTLFVSTIHKAKGREFDHVFLMLDGFNGDSDEAKRQVYVALTRAKSRLAIHTNGRFFDPIQSPDVQRVENSAPWLPPRRIAVHLTLKDIYLDYFTFIQHRVAGLMSGQDLQILPEGLADQSGSLVLRFSKKFNEQLLARRASGYALTEARVNFIVFWKNKEQDQEYKVVLPELVFEARERSTS